MYNVSVHTTVLIYLYFVYCISCMNENDFVTLTRNNYLIIVLQNSKILNSSSGDPGCLLKNHRSQM